ncbi:LysR family transcriptional regulator [Jatrophihabitans telluris]|uniref:LysR family transcriptional regulator n=1 Tax=Jatrophihabitans telluris TaxID=2038343 RepID=A0ABY4QX88_9ACTN|nr:LysR family transcriptional regulator [Jatrophihabitans telluris]UQX88145.1 LysR family transcriptional regulator [Jatrophihabitans telluris]
MELRQLEHFVAVADERHFTRAAEALSISQSGLSASIRALERELHTNLFVRNTRRVELTEAGRALLLESRRTLASANAARDAVAAVQGLLRGSLSVGAEQCIGVDVPSLLARFRAAYPGVEIALRQAGSTWLQEELLAGRLDVAFVASSGQPVDGLTLMPLTAEPMVLVCHPQHRLAGRKQVGVAELRDETFVDFHPEWGARVISDAAFATAGVHRPVTLEVNDVHTLLDLVLHDMGIALVPKPIAAKKAAKLAVVPVRPGEADPWQVSIAVPAGEAISLAAKAFATMVPGRSTKRIIAAPVQPVTTQTR